MKKTILMCIIILIFGLYDNVSANTDNFEVVNHCFDTNTTNTERITGRENIESGILPGMPANTKDVADESLLNNELISPFSILDERGLTFLSNVEPAPFCQITKIVACYDYNGNGVIEDNREKYPEVTGFMVGPGIVLTAAHCIWKRTNKLFPLEVRVYVKSNNKNLNTEYYNAHSWIIPSGHYNGNDDNYDWCVLTMKENLAVDTGWMGVGYTSKSIINKNIMVSGYPYDSKYQGHQCYSNGNIISETEYLIDHTANTLPGHSGSPIFDTDGIAWGIHTSGYKTFNRGVRITKELYSLLSQKISDAISHYYK